jgi:hypothetical protein
MARMLSPSYALYFETHTIMDHNIYCGSPIHYNALVINYVRMSQSLHRTGYCSGNALEYSVNSKIFLLQIKNSAQYNITYSKTVLIRVATCFDPST